MAEHGWNYHMNPPKYREVSDPDTYIELIHSISASKYCEKVAKDLAQCRKRPEGKLTHPEKCKDPAISLINCFKTVQAIPQPCKQHFDSTLNCLQTGKKCDSFLESYLSCDHPAASKYLN